MKQLEFDVAVIGGGPAGTVAAIASARRGAKTILVEQNGYLGGALTACGTGPQMTYHAGDVQVVRGIPQEMEEEMIRRGFSTGHIPDAVGFCSSTTAFDPEGMKIVWEDMAREAGVTLMYHTVFTGCTVENGVIRTARLYTKGGFYELSAKVFVDASADADVATSAGVTSVYGREEDNLAQPMTMNFHVYGVDREKVCDFVLNNLDDMARYTPRNLRELRHYDISGAFSRIQAAKDAGEFHIDRDTVLCFETNTDGEYVVNMTRIAKHSAVDPFDLTEAEIEGRKHVIVGYYTLKKCRSSALRCLQILKKGQKSMARNDGIDRTLARNQDLETPDDVTKVQEHNEREKDRYSNVDIVPERTALNVHFKSPTDDYVKMFEQMEQDGVISTRGLKPDAVKYGELIFDVNSAYFYNHGGYEFAKQFYADAYKAAVEIVGGEQYILSAVMHADERNQAMSEALGEDVYHYHLHVVYIPVVEKQILWSKRCKDESLRGTVKETITQVSRSKKWDSKPVLDEDGNPMLNAKGKKILKSSYSVLQDDFFNFMRNVGYTDVERGERGSTEEHLTVTQFKVQAEQQRLETVTGQVAQAEQSLENAKAATEKQKRKLEALQKETKTAKTLALTVQDIEAMGKKATFGNNITLTPDECRTLKDYAVSSFAVAVLFTLIVFLYFCHIVRCR